MFNSEMQTNANAFAAKFIYSSELDHNDKRTMVNASPAQPASQSNSKDGFREVQLRTKFQRGAFFGSYCPLLSQDFKVLST